MSIATTYRTCPRSGLQFESHAEKLMIANAVAAVVVLLIGGILAVADWMSRNMFGRIEVAWPVRDGQLRQRVIDECLVPYLHDRLDAWALAADDEGTAGILRDHYWEGWSVAEISTKREMSRRSVERALTLGRAWVHDWLSRAATRPAGVHDD